jgi:hypothetical protein
MAEARAEAIEFDLPALIMKVFEETRIADPAELAGVVFKRIPEWAFGQIVESLLPDCVREYQRLRRQYIPSVESTDTSSAKLKYHYVRPARLDTHKYILSLAYRVGRSWKLLGDCNEADLQFMIDQRRLNATRNLAVADQLEGLRSALRAHNVTRVCDLPKEAVCAFRGDNQ